MKFIKNNSIEIIVTSVILFLVFICLKFLKIEKDTELHIGKKYDLCWECSPGSDPFKEIKHDTILILDKKYGYVKFEIYNGGNPFINSGREKILIEVCKEIK